MFNLSSLQSSVSVGLARGILLVITGHCRIPRIPWWIWSPFYELFVYMRAKCCIPSHASSTIPFLDELSLGNGLRPVSEVIYSPPYIIESSV